MKFLHLATALSATVFSFMPFHTSVNAQEADYDCFMTTKSGQVVDLSESVCGIKKSASAAPVNSDQAFMEDYKRNVMKYSQEVSDTLLASAQETPEQSINQAKSLCSDLQAGIAFEEIQTQATESAETPDPDTANATIINTLATKYYCPELSKR